MLALVQLRPCSGAPELEPAPVLVLALALVPVPVLVPVLKGAAGTLPYFAEAGTVVQLQETCLPSSVRCTGETDAHSTPVQHPPQDFARDLAAEPVLVLVPAPAPVLALEQPTRAPASSTSLQCAYYRVQVDSISLAADQRC